MRLLRYHFEALSLAYRLATPFQISVMRAVASASMHGTIRLQTRAPILTQSIRRRPVRYAFPNLTRSPTLEHEPRFFQAHLCGGSKLACATIPSIWNTRWWVLTFSIVPY